MLAVAVALILSACATRPVSPPLTGTYVGYKDAGGKDFRRTVTSSTIAGVSTGGTLLGPVGAVGGAVLGAGTGVVMGAVEALGDIPCGNGTVDILFDTKDGERLTANATQTHVCHLKPGDPVAYYKDGNRVWISPKQQNIQQTYSAKPAESNNTTNAKTPTEL